MSIRSRCLGVSVCRDRVPRRGFLQMSAAAFGGALWPWSPASAGYSLLAQAPRITTTDLGGATLFQGAGCNVIAVSGPDGALMIDGGRAANAEALIAAVREATKTSRIHTLINTHWHPDQTGANEAIGRAGGVIFAHEKTKMMLSNTRSEEHTSELQSQSNLVCRLLLEKKKQK